MNILSLFDGMSCGQIALDRLGIKVDNYFASEIDKYAIQVTKANYPNTKHLGSVVDVKGADLPKIDLLIGGSPCQSFSFAGKMKGMTTKCNQEILTLEDYLKLKNDGFEFQGQSYLFWEYMRLLKECNPTYFLLENVVMAKKWQNVLSQTIGIDPIMINSSLLSAQNRRRLYWTNIGINKANLFGSEQAGIKQPKDKGILLKDVLESEVDAKYNMNMFNDSIKKNIDTIINSINNTKSTCIDGSYYKGFGTRSGKCRQVVKLDKKGKPKKNQDKASCFTAGGNSGGNHSDMDLLYIPNNKPVPEEHIKHPVALTEKRTEEAKKIRREHQQKYGKDFSPRRGKELAPRKDDKMNCLTATFSDKEHILLQPNLIIRRLTPIECERLQTVPDNYTNHVSDTQRYKMLGNGWTVDVIAYIFKHMKLNKDGI